MLLVASMAEARVFKMATGLGLEGRVDREINPGFMEMRPVGVLFQQISFNRWSANLEFGYQKKDSGAGSLRVQSVSGSVAAWARYNLIQSEKWSPFASTGAGASFDRVTSSYSQESDVRRGTRWMGGLGAGIATVYWNYLLLEGEARASVVEDRPDPQFAFIFRAGVQL
ncbi:MAG: hypothetical protein KF799_13040 [Bdellovibrionales bacterium]|nr:hypothetical protein [Bdellovibrionales bacterium]